MPTVPALVQARRKEQTMSAVRPAFQARRASPARVVGGALRVMTALLLLLLGIVVLLVALVGQGRAGARELDPAAADPSGAGTGTVLRDPAAVDAATVAAGQAPLLLAQVERPTDSGGWVSSRPLPVPPEPQAPDDAERRTSTVPLVAQITLPERLRPARGPAERGGADGTGGERGTQDFQAPVSPATRVAAGLALTLVAQAPAITPGPGQGQVPVRLIGDPEPIDYQKAAEGNQVVFVRDNKNYSKDKRDLVDALPQLVKLGFRVLTMDVLPTSVDPADADAVRAALNAAPFTGSAAAYYHLYERAKQLGMRVTPAYTGPVLPEEQGTYSGWFDKQVKFHDEVIRNELAAGGRVLALAEHPTVGYLPTLRPNDPQPVNTLLAQQGISSVVWQFHPEGGLNIGAPGGLTIRVPGEEQLDQLVKEHPEEFMVKVHAPIRSFDWLIVPRPIVGLAPADEPGQDPDGGPSPAHAQTPTTPLRDQHAVLPAPPEQLPESLATQEPDGQRVAAQAAAGNDGFTAVSDGLQTGPADLPSAVFGNDFTGQLSSAAAGGDAAPAMAAVAGRVDNLSEVPETAEVSADSPSEAVVADADVTGAGKDGVENGGDLFASDDASFGFG
jgi:hypothetical protein